VGGVDRMPFPQLVALAAMDFLTPWEEETVVKNAYKNH
jgi:hypothetical protein